MNPVRGAGVAHDEIFFDIKNVFKDLQMFWKTLVLLFIPKKQRLLKQLKNVKIKMGTLSLLTQMK